MEWEYVSGAVCGEHRPPACNCAQWTLQLTGQLLVPTTGNWTFFIPPSFDYTDDGTRLFIDGQPVLAGAWRAQGTQPSSCALRPALTVPPGDFACSCSETRRRHRHPGSSLQQDLDPDQGPALDQGGRGGAGCALGVLWVHGLVGQRAGRVLIAPQSRNLVCRWRPSTAGTAMLLALIGRARLGLLCPHRCAGLGPA